MWFSLRTSTYIRVKLRVMTWNKKLCTEHSQYLTHQWIMSCRILAVLNAINHNHHTVLLKKKSVRKIKTQITLVIKALKDEHYFAVQIDRVLRAHSRVRDCVIGVERAGRNNRDSTSHLSLRLRTKCQDYSIECRLPRRFCYDNEK